MPREMRRRGETFRTIGTTIRRRFRPNDGRRRRRRKIEFVDENDPRRLVFGHRHDDLKREKEEKGFLFNPLGVFCLFIDFVFITQEHRRMNFKRHVSIPRQTPTWNWEEYLVNVDFRRPTTVEWSAGVCHRPAFLSRPDPNR